MQDTFARVLARPRLLRGDDELAYLMRVLRNTFLTGRRTAGRRPRVAATLEDVEAPDPRSGERPQEALEAGEVFTAIAALPDAFRLALVAVDIVGLSYKEAADALGTREATIATRVFRARQQVVRAMNPGAAPPTATPPAPPGAAPPGPAETVSRDLQGSSAPPGGRFARGAAGGPTDNPPGLSADDAAIVAAAQPVSSTGVGEGSPQWRRLV